MSVIPFSTFDMSETQAQNLFEIFTNLNKTYSIEIDSNFLLDIKEFNVFEHDELSDYGPVFRIATNNNTFYLNFIEIVYKMEVASIHQE